MAALLFTELRKDYYFAPEDWSELGGRLGLSGWTIRTCPMLERQYADGSIEGKYRLINPDDYIVLEGVSLSTAKETATQIQLKEDSKWGEFIGSYQ